MFADHNKFRAKSKENNEWVYGKKYESVYCVNVDLSNTNRINKGSKKTYIFSGFDRKTEVNAKTISRCTGYLDCNENKIYTGDIISWKPNSNIDIDTIDSYIVIIGEVKNGCQIKIHKIIHQNKNNKNVSNLYLSALKGLIEAITDGVLLGYKANGKVEIIGNIFDDNIVNEWK